MPLLSVFARRIGIAGCICLFSCASHRPAPAANDVPLALEGEITVAGESLERAAVLSDAGGNVCVLRSPKLEYELLSLAGHRLRVVGRIAGKTSGGPEFLVERYEMLPVDGRVPLIGTIELRDSISVLREQASGTEYVLGGPLGDALALFAGYKVWASGEVFRGGEGGADAPSVIEVESYGVLVPDRRATDGEP